MGNGLIFGRSPNLVLAAVLGLYNVVAVFHILGFAPTDVQSGVVNVALAAIIGVIANTASIQVAAGHAATARRAAK